MLHSYLDKHLQLFNIAPQPSYLPSSTVVEPSVLASVLLCIVSVVVLDSEIVDVDACMVEDEEGSEVWVVSSVDWLVLGLVNSAVVLCRVDVLSNANVEVLSNANVEVLCSKVETKVEANVEVLCSNVEAKVEANVEVLCSKVEATVEVLCSKVEANVDVLGCIVEPQKPQLEFPS